MIAGLRFLVADVAVATLMVQQPHQEAGGERLASVSGVHARPPQHRSSRRPAPIARTRGRGCCERGAVVPFDPPDVDRVANGQQAGRSAVKPHAPLPLSRAPGPSLAAHARHTGGWVSIRVKRGGVRTWAGAC